MKPKFPIYIDRLKNGAVEAISEEIDPMILGLNDNEITCKDPIVVSGKAYLVEDFLIIHLKIKAKIYLKCALCSEVFPQELELDDVHEEESLDQLPQGIFDFSETIRQAIFLEVPFYPQCGGKECLNRKDYEKYLKKESKEGDKALDSDERYSPFQSLD